MKLTSLPAVLIALASIAACDDHLDIEDFYQNKLTKDSFFDFNTSDSVRVSLDYGPLAAGSLIEFYAEDPVSKDVAEHISPDGEAFYKIFADSQGRIDGYMTVPSYADTIYVVSRSFGAPYCLAAPVENGTVTVSLPVTKSQDSPKTKVSSTLQLKYVADGLYSLVDWASDFGAPNDVNDLITDGTIESSQITGLQYALWGGRTSKPDGLNNSSYVRSTDHINTTIAETFVNSEGQTVTTGSAEIFFTFLNESGWYQNTIGYYYYEAGKQPSSSSEVKKFIILPNASVTGNAPFGVQGNQYFDASKAPVTANTKIQLLYENEDGTLTQHFPAGLTIGYFIISDGFKVTESKTSSGGGAGGFGGWGGWGNYFKPGSQTSTTTTYSGKVNASGDYVWSDAEWNAGGKARFISLTTSGGVLVYGVEDNSEDASFEDVLFTITSTPQGAIQDPDKPVISDDVNARSSTETTYRTYAFEDLWPIAGDYDMNDVVIEHTETVDFNSSNYVTGITDKFKVVNHIKSAELADAFAVVIGQRGDITIPQGAVDETATSSIILFENAQDNLGKSFTIKRTFDAGALHKSDLVTDLDPYIIAGSPERAGYTEKNRFEVHMPKKEGTSYNNPYYYGFFNEAYYLDKDGKHPFAITIPLSSTEGSGLRSFTQAVEMTPIGDEYPKYESWVESRGATDADWYLHYREP